METLLPIGTIIHAEVEIGVVSLMIIGYFPKKNDTGRIYEYSAVLYPQGVDFNTNIFLINHSMILNVIHEGYKDELAEHLITEMPILIEKMEKIAKEQDASGDAKGKD